MAGPPLDVFSSLRTVIAENRAVIIAPYINAYKTHFNHRHTSLKWPSVQDISGHILTRSVDCILSHVPHMCCFAHKSRFHDVYLFYSHDYSRTSVVETYDCSEMLLMIFLKPFECCMSTRGVYVHPLYMYTIA